MAAATSHIKTAMTKAHPARGRSPASLTTDGTKPW